MPGLRWVVSTVIVAVFALCALVGVASASAGGPAWYECKATKGAPGHYAGRLCDKYRASGGRRELVPGVRRGRPFVLAGGRVVLHIVDPFNGVDQPITCESFGGSGRPVAPNRVEDVRLRFSSCSESLQECHNVAAGTIETAPLSGELGWLDKTAGRVGIDLYQERQPGATMAQFTCDASAEIRIGGSVVGELRGDVGKISTSSELVYSPGTYLGALESTCPTEANPQERCTWTPIVNVPEFERGVPDILLTEVWGATQPNEFGPPDGIPSGIEATATINGEAVGIFP